MHLRTDILSTLKALDDNCTIYIKNNELSNSSRSLLQAETLTTNAKLVYVDSTTPSAESQEGISGKNKKSERDSADRELSEGQRAYFKDSKVRDKLLNDVIERIPDIKTYTHALRDNDIRHIKNSHGENTPTSCSISPPAISPPPRKAASP